MLAPTLSTSRLALASLSLAASLTLLACERPAADPPTGPGEPSAAEPPAKGPPAGPGEPSRAEPPAKEELAEPDEPSGAEPRAEEERADSAGDEPAPSSLAWTLTAEPSTFTVAELDEVRLRIEVKNNGTATVKPLHPWDFRVDGEPSMSLSMAFGNGARPRIWQALPPGKRATDERVGVSFVDVAGEHVISVHDGDRELARVVVQVEEP